MEFLWTLDNTEGATFGYAQGFQVTRISRKQEWVVSIVIMGHTTHAM